ncbi:hypothetical protein FB451DRAFT_1477649 [Mycena latifolia]|nr:hypothetical protein FB451DRAFT_1477649 [Mycena latifolia]
MAQNTLGLHTTAAEAADAFAREIKGKNAKLQLSADAIKKEVSSANIRKLTLDLSSLTAVRAAAADVNAYTEPLHVLINDAAAAIAKLTVSADNLENQMATRHIGPSSLRICSCRSSSPPQPPQPPPSPRVGHAGPGEKPDGLEALKAHGVLDAKGRPDTTVYQWKSIPEGAATTVVAAFDPSLSDKPGAYLDDCKDATDKIAPHSSDPASVARLWEVTEKLVGQSFEF